VVGVVILWFGVQMEEALLLCIFYMADVSVLGCGCIDRWMDGVAMGILHEMAQRGTPSSVTLPNTSTKRYSSSSPVSITATGTNGSVGKGKTGRKRSKKAVQIPAWRSGTHSN